MRDYFLKTGGDGKVRAQLSSIKLALVGAACTLSAGVAAANPSASSLSDKCANQYMGSVTVESIFIMNPYEFVTLRNGSGVSYTYRLYGGDGAIGSAAAVTANLLRVAQTAFNYHLTVNVCVGASASWGGEYDLVGIELKN